MISTNLEVIWEMSVKVFMKVAFVLVGLVMLGAGGWWFMDIAELRSVGQTVPGVVTGVKTRNCSDANHNNFACYSRIVRFNPGTGGSVEFTSSEWSSRQPRKGEQVMVLFDPAAPQDAVLDNGAAIWVPPTIFTSGGLFFILIGVFVNFGAKLVQRAV